MVWWGRHTTKEAFYSSVLEVLKSREWESTGREVKVNSRLSGHATTSLKTRTPSTTGGRARALPSSVSGLGSHPSTCVTDGGSRCRREHRRATLSSRPASEHYQWIQEPFALTGRFSTTNNSLPHQSFIPTSPLTRLAGMSNGHIRNNSWLFPSKHLSSAVFPIYLHCLVPQVKKQKNKNNKTNHMFYK